MDVATRQLTVALVGNPNTGKSTLFTALAGVRQRVGNYPGVTVEKKVGRMECLGRRFQLVDLPGTYSLAPRSPDEMVAVDVLLGRVPDLSAPDAVLCIVDASNLERNLYLVSQVLELGLPTVVVLNMIDLARQRGLTIDAARLSERLGVPVVEVQANRRIGIERVREALVRVVQGTVEPRGSPFPLAFVREVSWLEQQLASANGASWPRYLVERLLLDTSGYLQRHFRGALPGECEAWLAQARQRLQGEGCGVPAVEAVARYGWVGRVLDGAVTRTAQAGTPLTDRIDHWLTHRVIGTLFLVVVMLLVFQAVFTVAEVPMQWVDAGVGWLGGLVEEAMPAGALRSLLVQGVIGGVGAVVVFVPQIMMLFFFLAILEDCGYLARAAYLMDKLMVRVGLSGKSFIPLLSSFACAIPGIMAARVIENRRDRLTTILVAPLMSCSARLPLYVVLIEAFVPKRAWLGNLLQLQALVFVGLYALGIVVAAGVALVLKRTLLRGPTPPFVMELPSYKWPSAAIVLQRMVERAWAFVRRAGTLILAVSILVWAALYYPRDEAAVQAALEAQRAQVRARLAAVGSGSTEAADLAEQLAELESPEAVEGEFRRQSLLGRAGRWIEPVVRPLGWDWRVGCAVIASFPAREVVVATLGVLYNVGEQLDVEEGSDRLRLQRALRVARWQQDDRPVFTLPMSLGLLVFFALCAQCASTLIIIRRETQSWGWPLFTFGYMTALAYLGAWMTYRVALGFG
jgi:ferrous iron transport protein B